MKNFKQQGQTIELIAPTAGVTGGQPLTQNGFTGVVSATASSGDKFELVLGGVFTFPKASAYSSPSIGDDANFNTAGEIVNTVGLGTVWRVLDDDRLDVLVNDQPFIHC